MYCLFNCQACHHTFILNLCSVCRPVSYICRVSHCSCSSAAKKFNAQFLQWEVKVFFFGKICLSAFIVTNIFLFQLRTFLRVRFTNARHPGNISRRKRASFVAIENCSTLEYLLSKILVHVLSWLSSHGTCIHLLHTIKLDLFSVYSVYLITLFNRIHGGILASR